MSNGNKNGVEPTALVIFGATGDLARKKLFPALFDLYGKGKLPKKFQIICFGRRELSIEQYREFIKAAIQDKKKDVDTASFNDFLNTIKYVRGLFEDDTSYKGLSDELARADHNFNVCSNKLFYLAVPPTLYELILNKLSHSGLTIPCSNGEGWTRVLIEKPFGKDTETARRLDRLLGKLFNETQIFRIDHYLAKETLQNILAFRFSNAIFEPIWDNKHIERIEIRILEKNGIEGRGAFYDGIGALRDIGQNHLLTMLSLVTMEYPKGYTVPAIRKERARALSQLIPISGSSVRKVVRGQYEGYRSEQNIAPDSDTETFFSLTAYLRSKRWKGVPIELSNGKALSEDKAEIRVYFKDVNCGVGDVKCNRNILTFRIQPNEGISVVFWVKKPGFENETHPQVLSFNYGDAPETKQMPDAYERLLYDCIRGDQMLFASTEEEEAAWKFVTPILERWAKNPMRNYKKGSSFENVIKNGR